MKSTAITSGTMVLALLVGRSVSAADPQPGQPVVVPPPAAKSAIPEVIPGSPALAPRADGLPAGSVQSPWIEYNRPDCCGPMGGGPIGGEWYMRTGPSMPVSNGILHDALDNGWMVQAGARSLFFNRDTTAAWTADAGISYTYNNSSRGDLLFQQNFLSPVTVLDPAGNPVTIAEEIERTVNIREFHRASCNLTFGREWYVWKPAFAPGIHWRFGGDAGGRWGYARLNLNDVTDAPTTITFRHNSDVFGAFSLSMHNDFEIPLRGSAVFLCGFRAEWVYNWTDIVPSDVGRDLQDVNILLNMGWRY